MSRHFISQSEVKPKPIVTYSQAFSRAWRGLHVFASSSDWFIGASALLPGLIILWSIKCVQRKAATLLRVASASESKNKNKISIPSSTSFVICICFWLNPTEQLIYFLLRVRPSNEMETNHVHAAKNKTLFGLVGKAAKIGTC